MAHLHPDRLRDAMEGANLNAPALSAASGVHVTWLQAALDGQRRLNSPAIHAVAEPLGVSWLSLRCSRAHGKPECEACAAPNELSDEDLADAATAIAKLIRALRVKDAFREEAPFDRWTELPSYRAARAALVAVGATIPPDDLDEVLQVAREGRGRAWNYEEAGLRLARYWGHADTETEELVGLDADLDFGRAVPRSLHIAGWRLRRYDDADLDEFDVIPGTDVLLGRRGRHWDRTAAAATWWLQRPAGVQPALGNRIWIATATPREVAAQPLLALALLSDDPPLAISYGQAQRGRGVHFNVGSQELDWFDEGEHRQFGYGRYWVDDSDEWERQVSFLGDLVKRVFDARVATKGPRESKEAFEKAKKAAEKYERYAVAAEHFLGVGAELSLGWDPLPRLPLEISTVSEMLLLGSGDQGDICRRVRIAASWLGGVDDSDRENIHAFVGDLYKAGSGYRHGGARYTLHRGETKGGKALDVSRAYRLLRRLMLHGLAVVAAGESVADLCDRAQRTVAARDRIEEHIVELYDSLGIPLRPFSVT